MVEQFDVALKNWPAYQVTAILLYNITSHTEFKFQTSELKLTNHFPYTFNQKLLIRLKGSSSSWKCKMFK